MNTLKPSTAALTAAATAMAATRASAATDCGRLIAQLKSPDDTAATEAWQSAQNYGAAAVKPLAALLTAQDFEVARRAKHALYKIVRHANRPGAKSEARAVEAELIDLLREPNARREALWLLSEIGSDRAIEPMAALLAEKEYREDARCALGRIPGKKVTTALRAALNSAPAEFRYALADSLRARGERVADYPTRKMLPTAQTTVVPAAPKEK